MNSSFRFLIQFLKLLPYCFFLIFFPITASADAIKPFTSDGCSAFPDGTREQNTLWLACCSAHDYAYWKGGTYKERLKADQDLEKCVAAAGEKKIATLMLAGVRVGGSPFWPTTFRWGYGWPYPRFYKALTEEDLLQIEQLESESRQLQVNE